MAVVSDDTCNRIRVHPPLVALAAQLTTQAPFGKCHNDSKEENTTALNHMPWGLTTSPQA